MNERFSVRLGNPVAIFFWSSAMLLTGIVIGAHWHPSRAWVMASGVAAGLFMVAHELVSSRCHMRPRRLRAPYPLEI